MRYQVLLVAEIDCDEPDGSDLQDKLDEYRERVGDAIEHDVTLFRPVAATVEYLTQRTDPEGWPAAEPVFGDE